MSCCVTLAGAGEAEQGMREGWCGLNLPSTAIPSLTRANAVDSVPVHQDICTYLPFVLATYK